MVDDAQREMTTAGPQPGRLATRLRAGRAAEIAAAAALFILVAALCTTYATDTDLYWHLETGERIIRTGEVPRSEPYSFTAIGHRWIDLHWLFQVVLTNLHGLGGIRLLDFGRAAIVLGVFAVLYRRCRRAAPAAATVAVLLLAALAAQERFLMRPEIVSWAMFLAALGLVRRALDAERRPTRLLILFGALPGLQVVWANVQGLFLLGPAVVALGLLTSGVDYARDRRDPDRPVDFLAALAAASLVSLVNPYGAGAVRLALEQFFGHLGGKTLLSRSIAEFRPPLSGYLVTPSIVAFVLLAALTLLALLADFPRARGFDLLVTLATLVVALRARRNIPIFALAAAPVLARHGAGLLEAAAAPLGRLRSVAWARFVRARAELEIVVLALLTVVTLALVAGVTGNRFFLKWPTERWFGSGEIPHYFPAESAAFVADAALPGNVFHSLWAGGYLIRAWGGRRGVYIDGRNDPFVEDVLPAYLKAIADPAAFEETAGRYQITTVLWPHQRAIEGKTLLAYLSRGRGWALVHLDPAAAVYLRADLLTPARLSEAPFAPGRPARETWEGLARRLDAEPFAGPPIREIALAEFFSVSGDSAAAGFFYRRALDRLPGNAAVLYGYGLSLERQGRAAEARDAYARAVAADPGYLPARAALGAFLLDEGRTDEAERHLDAAYEGGERGVRVHEARALLFERRGEIARALQAYREALSRTPRDPALLRSLAQFYVRQGEPDAALPFYTSAAAADPDNSAVAREMAALLDRLGRTTAALDVARDAARRAVDRLTASRGAAGRRDDRALLTFAAELETRAGDPERATQYLSVLRATESSP